MKRTNILDIPVGASTNLFIFKQIYSSPLDETEVRVAAENAYSVRVSCLENKISR